MEADNQRNGVSPIWPRCDDSEAEGYVAKLRLFIDSLVSAEIPVTAWRSGNHRQSMAKSNDQSPDPLFVVIESGEALSSLVGKSFHGNAVSVRKLDHESFSRREFDEPMMLQMERDIWFHKIATIITVVDVRGMSSCELNDARKNWSASIDFFYEHSPIFRSYADRGDVRQALVFFDPRDFTFNVNTHDGVFRKRQALDARSKRRGFEAKGYGAKLKVFSLRNLLTSVLS